MPRRNPTRLPAYRHFKPRNLAVVRLSGKDHYLGPHGSPESREKYRRLVAEWLANAPAAGNGPPTAGPGLSVGELIVAYVTWADGYYLKGGEPTSEPGNIRAALRPLRHLYSLTTAAAFGPLGLKAVRQSMVDAGICRTETNKRVRQIVRMFKWAVSNELVAPAVHEALRCVPGLKAGRSEARESEPVGPVPESDVEATIPFLPPAVAAMVRLQLLTGMRPGEVCMLRTCDVEAGDDGVWTYRPASHKTQHHSKERVVLVGPKAREVLKPWLDPADPDTYCFSPARGEAMRRAGMRAKRKTPVQPSQRDRRKRHPKRPAGDCYDTTAYGRAITRACKKAGVARWRPNQLRHTAATKIRREFGIDAAQVVLGHSSPAVTTIYAEADRQKAAAVMESLG